MPVQRPQFFGFEGIVYWSNTLFPVNQSAGKYTCTQLEMDNWITAASKSDDLRTINIAALSETVDTTPRGAAVNGWLQSKRLPIRISMSIVLDHAISTAGGLVHGLISAWESGAEIGLCALDHEAGTAERGIVGNFHISMSKSEPLRSIQEWTATCEPQSFVDWYES